MCIEDPFELSHDLGRTIDKAAVQVGPPRADRKGGGNPGQQQRACGFGGAVVGVLTFVELGFRNPPHPG